ncbi:phage terminase small subunit [Paenibacillus macquariensis]
MAGHKYKEIAEKYGVTLNTVKSWKQRHSWSRDMGAPFEKGVHTNRGGAPPGNKNAIGNDGGAPEKNSNAVTHGFFRKFLPDDTLEIMEEIETRSLLDMMWDQITIQYAAILRAQQIMFVANKEDVTKVLTKSADNAFGGSEEWEYQHAWDKQASFLQAQSRAMSTLQSMIKQYEDMCRQGHADEEQQLKISKLKAEVKALDKVSAAESVVFKDDLHE